MLQESDRCRLMLQADSDCGYTAERLSLLFKQNASPHDVDLMRYSRLERDCLKARYIKLDKVEPTLRGLRKLWFDLVTLQ